jgi:hypothetical protein
MVGTAMVVAVRPCYPSIDSTWRSSECPPIRPILLLTPVDFSTNQLLSNFFCAFPTKFVGIHQVDETIPALRLPAKDPSAYSILPQI